MAAPLIKAPAPSLLTPDGWLLGLLRRVVPRAFQRAVPVWYDREYRLPISTLESRMHVEPRRADFVVWYLLEMGIVRARDLRKPVRVSYADLARVHTPEHLESLARPETLARIFGVDPNEIPVDEVLSTVRLACGATIAAARSTLATGRPEVNLLGGFHHAAPAHGGGMCVVNDIAVAVAALRAEGFDGQVVVIDLDAHPPDGTALCLESDPRSWIGSLSGSDWGPLARCDETCLPEGTGDVEYLAALRDLLRRMPRPALAFVIAGGDVLGGDAIGRLGLDSQGAAERDLVVAAALNGVPMVWLPGGGYRPDAWHVLARTVSVLARGTIGAAVPRTYDPLASRLRHISDRHLDERLLHGDLSDEDVGLDRAFAPRSRRLLGYYSAEGIEYALFRFGILTYLHRLGYDSVRFVIDKNGSGGDRGCVFGTCDGEESLLIDLAVEKKRIGDEDLLYVHWLSLRNPRARFTDQVPALPGQDVPGLGLAREIAELLGLMAKRLGLAGIAYRPAFYHTAWPARDRLRFIDPRRQGRFEALIRDLSAVPLRTASLALRDGRVLMNGEPYEWEPDEMAWRFSDLASDAEVIATERDRAHFQLLPAAP